MVRDLTSWRVLVKKWQVSFIISDLVSNRGLFDRFLKKDRRENRNLFSQYIKAQLQASFLQTDLIKPRKLLDTTSGAGRAMVLGMPNHKSDAQRLRASCPHCQDPAGTFDHLMYECIAFPPIPRPVNPLLQRFAWVPLGEMSQVPHQTTLFKNLLQVVEEHTWQAIYDNG